MADKTDAWIDGWLAHKNSENNSDEDNPYDEYKQARSYAQWVSGWCARHSAIKAGINTVGYDNGAWEE
jgi:hypothetical protein